MDFNSLVVQLPAAPAGWKPDEKPTGFTMTDTIGAYTAGFRVASNRSSEHFDMYLDDGTTPIATVDVPNTGEWPAFQTVSVPVTLPAGQHRLKLSFPTDFVNINWIRFGSIGA